MSGIQYWPAMPPGRCSLSNCTSTQLDCNSCRSKSSLHLRAAFREARQERLSQSMKMRLSADSAASDIRRSDPAEETHGARLTQYSNRPVRTPKSEDPQQLPAHRRLRLQIHPAELQPKQAQRAPRYNSAEHRQEGSRPAVGSLKLQALEHSRSALATKEFSDRATHYTRDTTQRPGHPQLQPYWSALESGTLQGESVACLLLRYHV